MRILTVNCQSIVNKKSEFSAMLHYIKPDVVCGTESWLKPDIKSSEIFPDDVVVYRKDRGTLGRGVFTRST